MRPLPPSWEPPSGAPGSCLWPGSDLAAAVIWGASQFWCPKWQFKPLSRNTHPSSQNFKEMNMKPSFLLPAGYKIYTRPLSCKGHKTHKQTGLNRRIIYQLRGVKADLASGTAGFGAQLLHSMGSTCCLVAWVSGSVPWQKPHWHPGALK